MVMKKIFQFKIFKFLFIMFYSIFFAEFFLRIFSPIPMLPRYIKALSFGIRGNMEKQKYYHKTPDYKILIKTNSRGIRANKDFSYHKSKNNLRIIVLGDSFGMGYGVNLKETFLYQMKIHLTKNYPNKKIEVINLSVSGHGNAEELIMLKEEGFKYDPDLVLLCWHRTDILDNIRSKLFFLKNEELLQNSKTYLPGVKIREFLFQYSIYKFLAGNSHLYNWLRDQAGIIIKKLMISTSTQKKKQNIKNKKTLDDNKILTLKILEQIKKECTKNKIKFLIFDIPEHKKREKYWSVFPISPDYIFHKFSPTDNFNQNKGKRLYWEKSHGHFTPEGCKISGKLLAEYIIENTLFK